MGKVLVMNAGLPWENEKAAAWVQNSDALRKTCQLVEGTLRLDAQQYPHQIRAAAAMVIMLGRPGLWSTLSHEEEIVLDDIDKLVSLAQRGLSAVRTHFESKGRQNPELLNRPEFKNLLDSMLEEQRILESRMSETPSRLPQKPPCSWGTFW